MICNDVQKNIEAYLDDELTLSDRREFEKHLADCKHCQSRLDNAYALNNAIKKVGYANKPTGLRRNIKNALRDISGEDSPGFNWFHMLGFGGASTALASLTVWAVMSVYSIAPVQIQLSDELIDAHVRSLLVDHITDVASSDRHTVKPWFNGRLDFSPTVLDMSEHGYPLVGGRMDYVQKQPVAALVYKRRAHLINLFIQRSATKQTVEQDAQSNTVQQQGYNLIHWQHQGLNYTLVSDLNGKELETLAKLLIAKN